MADDPDGPAPGVPAFGASKLLLIGTGSLSVAFLPFWLNWLREAYAHLEVRTVLTRTAERFVSREALTAIGGSVALADAWPEEPGTGALHVELARWPDAVAVHPASMHFLARFAVGLADSPVLLALQCTAAPVAVAPALPPGALEHSAALVEHLATLDRRGVLIAAPHPGRSASTGGNDAAVAAPLPALLGLLERRRAATAVP